MVVILGQQKDGLLRFLGKAPDGNEAQKRIRENAKSKEEFESIMVLSVVDLKVFGSEAAEMEQKDADRKAASKEGLTAEAARMQEEQQKREAAAAAERKSQPASNEERARLHEQQAKADADAKAAAQPHATAPKTPGGVQQTGVASTPGVISKTDKNPSDNNARQVQENSKK